MEYLGFKIKNYMESLVLQNIDEILKNRDVCKCEKCLCDIVALVLNDLPPHYVVSDLGETYTKAKVLNSQFKVDLVTAVSKAASTVKDSPRHEHNPK